MFPARLLNSARQKLGSGDIDGSLVDYETVVHVGANLPEVIEELRGAMSRYKDHPAVYRVLGDALMRGGKLRKPLTLIAKPSICYSDNQ
ncbi:MAG: hypothetical protein U0694_06195 [Anaerolineae bacterium]